MSNLVISKANSSNLGFCVSWYEKCKWITGSEIRNRLFCWPCLLFSEQRQGRWNCTGFNNRKEICSVLQKHGISKDHTQALLKFKLLGKKQQNIANVLDNAHRQSVIEYNRSHRKS
jgi:hypothetical protein